MYVCLVLTAFHRGGCCCDQNVFCSKYFLFGYDENICRYKSFSTFFQLFFSSFQLSFLSLSLSLPNLHHFLTHKCGMHTTFCSSDFEHAYTFTHTHTHILETCCVRSSCLQFYRRHFTQTAAKVILFLLYCVCFK